MQLTIERGSTKVSACTICGHPKIQARGLCTKHYSQALRRRSITAFPTKSEMCQSDSTQEVKAARFRQYAPVGTVEDCWNWTGPTCKETRYGIFNWRGGKIKAHRVAYEMSKGPIPSGLLVMHSCDNRLCVNPAHLSCGTNLDNMHDAARKSRMHWKPTKLTPDDVREIRRLYATGDESYSTVAARFGVSWMMVRQIVKGLAWRWVE